MGDPLIDIKPGKFVRPIIQFLSHIRKLVVPAASAVGMSFVPAQDLVAAESKSPGRPNILFCMADDWGWPHAGAYGDKIVQTPAFDRIASEGALFEHAYVSSPSCTPSRNAVTTGQQFYRLEAGARLWSTLDVEYANFMFLLRDSGYEIGRHRKTWGPGNYEKGGYPEHPHGKHGDFTSFLEERDKNAPFCFWLGTNRPHRPYAKGSGAKSGIDVDQVHVPEFYPDVAKVRSDIADYLGLTTETVSRTLTRLKNEGAIEVIGSGQIRLLRPDDLTEIAEAS